MRFLYPQMLWLLLLLPLGGLAMAWSVTRRGRALEKFAGGREFAARFRGEVSAHRRAVKSLLIFAALFAVIVAAARPQWGTRLEPIERKGVDVVVVLDTSLSMAADDIAPSRIDQARNQIDALIEKLAGNRVALVTFAGQATLTCPLTLDHTAVRLFLETVEIETMQVPGTAMADALRLAVRAFGDDERPGEERGRAVILFSDGEDHEGGTEDVLDEVEQGGIVVHAVGCGSTRGGPIPLRDESGVVVGYKKDREGKVVTTRLDEGVLEQLALGSGGRYHRATSAGAEVEEIVQALTSLDAREYGAVLRTRYEERFQVPLGIAVILLLAETVLGDRRGRRRRARQAEPKP